MKGPGSKAGAFPSGKLTAKLACLAVFASLIASLAISGASVFAVYAPLKQRGDEILSATLDVSASRVRELLAILRTDVESLARDPELIGATLAAVSRDAGAPSPGSELPELLARAFARRAGFDGFVVVDLQGAILANAGTGPAIASALEALRPKDVSRGAELVEIMETKQLQTQLGRLDGSLIRALPRGVGPRVVIAASPMIAADGSAIGSVLGLIRQEAVAERLGAALLGSSGNVVLVDGDGRLVSAARHAAAGDAASPALENPGDVGCRSGASWMNLRDGGLTCRLSLGALGWTLIAQQPLHEVLQPLLVMLPSALIAAAIAALGLSLLASWIVVMGVRPIARLHRGIVAVAQGDFSTVVSDRSAPSEMKNLISAFNRLVRRLRDRREEFESSERALKVQNLSFQQRYTAASELSVTDALTKLPNRRFFEEYLDAETNRLGRSEGGLCLLVIDIDDFKMLNDTYGHAAGDEFLKQTARIMNENVRNTDLIARFGGEEFVIVANGTTLQGAGVLAEKVRTSVAESSFIIDDSMRPRRATVSIGLAQYRGSKTGLFSAADAALYRAKESGKNCVVAADE